jgi:dCMP deaminase
MLFWRKVMDVPLCEVPSWDEYFMGMLAQVASRSKDPNTHVGCVVVGPDREIRTTGYNSFPRGVVEFVPERLERPLKYKFIEHAERNAIYNAARIGVSLKGCTIYQSWYPCSDCARGIIGSGISFVVIDDNDDNPWKSPESNARWQEDMDVARQMLAEAGVEIRKWRRGNVGC